MKQYNTQPKKLYKYYNKSQIESVLEKSRSNQRDYLIMLTLWRTGMRVSELTKLKKKDLSEVITIRQGKGSKDRIIPFHPTLKDLLMLYSAGMNLEDRLFPLTNAQVWNITKRYQGELELHPHTFRHSFAVHCLKEGMNVRVLQKILGHSNLNTTAVYLDLIGEDIKEGYAKIPW